MTYFGNALRMLMDIEDRLLTAAADAHVGEVDADELTDLHLELRDVIEEFKDTHKKLLQLEALLQQTKEIRL